MPPNDANLPSIQLRYVCLRSDATRREILCHKTAKSCPCREKAAEPVGSFDGGLPEIFTACAGYRRGLGGRLIEPGPDLVFFDGESLR